MRTEINLDWQNFMVILVVAIAFSIIGFNIAKLTTPIQEPIDLQEINCLTSQDLNTDHLDAVVILSRFCEGQGLQSGVYWQQDQNGNVYAIPICIQPQGAE